MNLFDMTQSSKNQIDKSKRINKQAQDYLNKYTAELRESVAAEEAKKNEAAMSAARFSIGSTYTRSKNRVNALREEIEYNENSAVIGMSEMVAEVVERALLLDESILQEMYPEYKEDIRSIVSGFLRNGNINENIRNIDTLQLMEYVARTLPGAREGKTLTEDELANYIASKKPVNIDKSIRELSGDVSSHVATLMEKDQKKADEIEKEVNKVAKKVPAKKDEEVPAAEDTPELTVDDIVAGLRSGDITQKDVDDALASGEIDQETYDAIMNAMQPSETAPVASSLSTTSPKKQIQLLPDGSMNVNIFESQLKLVKETPRSGLLESLAVNEAYSQLNEGKSYNSDLCLAKALMYVTITEAMNVMGLMNVTENDYAKIVQKSGGFYVKPKRNLTESEDKDSENDKEDKDDDEEKSDETESEDEKDDDDNKEEPVEESVNFNLTEAIIAARHVPFCANAGFAKEDDLAERIRKKRLNEATIINE